MYIKKNAVFKLLSTLKLIRCLRHVEGTTDKRDVVNIVQKKHYQMGERAYIDGVAIQRPIFHSTAAPLCTNDSGEKQVKVPIQKKKNKNRTHIHPHTQSPMGQACVCACARFTHILVDKEGTIKQWTCEQFVVCLCVCTMLVGVHTRWLDMSNDIPQRQTLVIKKMR